MPAHGAMRRLRTSGLFVVVAEQAGGEDGGAAVAAGDPVDGAGQVLPADGRRVKEWKLAASLWTEGRGGHADQSHGLDQPLARQQQGGAAVDLQAILGGIAGVAAREGGEVG